MSRALDIHPAWGFETLDRWKVAVEQRDQYLKQQGKDPKQYFHREWGEQRIALNNVSKVLAYFPGLNVIVGIARIVLALQDRSEDPVKRAIIAKHIYRGLAEIFLGPLLIIPDLVQTILDRDVVQAYLKTHP